MAILSKFIYVSLFAYFYYTIYCDIDFFNGF